jgi:hypothetical protein
MQGRWGDLLLAAVFAVLAVGCVSLAATAVLAGGIGHPEFIPAAVATAVVLGALAIWSYPGAR